MKRILAFVMVLAMIISISSFGTYAVEVKDTLYQELFDYFGGNNPNSYLGENPKVYIYDYAEADGMEFVCAVASWRGADTMACSKDFGRWHIYSPLSNSHSALSLYVKIDGKIYTIEEAWKDGLVDDLTPIEHFYEYTIVYGGYSPNPKNKYEDDVIQKLFSQEELNDSDNEIVYSEKYGYYSDNSSSADERTPDYVLVFVYGDRDSHYGVESTILGGYIVRADYGYTPFTFGYAIYMPQTDELYSLEEAYETGVEGIEKVFTEAKIGKLLGDMDNDRKLTIKDATYIQKMLAGFKGYYDVTIYSRSYNEKLPISNADFDYDRAVTVKDATAIQKYLAGIEL